MRIVTIRSSSLQKYKVDKEMLQKAKRPCVLIIRLPYKGKRYDFAVPIRSNINPSTPKNQYFPLPPRSTTRSGCRHGIHYIKMFPVDRAFLIRYRTEGNPEAERIKTIIDRNEKKIISECAAYLKNYEQGICPPFSTDIDLLIKTAIDY